MPKVDDFDIKSPEESPLKSEQVQIEENCASSNTDILNTDSNELNEDDYSFSYDNEDDDDEIEDSSSDTSYVEIKETPKKAGPKSSKTKKTHKKGESSKLKKCNRKISVTTVNVMDEDRRLLSYVQMKCDVCSDDRVFESFSDIQTHFLDIHNQNGYIICCNRKFRRIGRVLQHCTWHDNPEAFKCDTCNKCFQDNVCLRDHITSMHIPANEKRFQCDQCNRLFAKQHLLNTHLKMKHTIKEERPFVCTEGECQQRFVLPAYLRLHIEKVHNKSDSRYVHSGQLSHIICSQGTHVLQILVHCLVRYCSVFADSSEFWLFLYRVCDVCARFFKCSKSYERHYQVEHTNIDQRVQCDLCQKWFKHLDTLKDHIRRHYAASATCKYCGRVSSNKKSLRLHVRNVHADIDSSVKTKNEFPCNVCEKIFKKKQTLRVSKAVLICITVDEVRFKFLYFYPYRSTWHCIQAKLTFTRVLFAQKPSDQVPTCMRIAREIIRASMRRSVFWRKCKRPKIISWSTSNGWTNIVGLKYVRFMQNIIS